VIGRPTPAGHCCGERIVYTQAPLTIDAATLARWSTRTDLHDIPSAPIDLPADAPVLSVSATGPDTAAVMLALEQRRADVLRELLPGQGNHNDRTTARSAWPGLPAAVPSSISTPSSRDALATEAIPS
jgi:hypothetical protein